MAFLKLIILALAFSSVSARRPMDPDAYGPFEPQQIHLTIGSHAKFATVNFATNEATTKTLARYWREAEGEAPSKVKAVEGRQFFFDEPGSENRYQFIHTVTFSALRPASTYRYQVCTRHKKKEFYWSEIFTFHTIKEGGMIDIVGFGDLGLENSVALDAIIEDHKKRDYDFALYVGDMAYDLQTDNGTVGDEYLNMMQPLIANIPFQPTAGNHEQPMDYAHYINRFSNIPSSGWENNLQWSFDYSYLHIIIINNEYYFHNHTDEEHDPTCWDDLANAYVWLEEDLKTAQEHRDKTPWIIVMSHRPLYCSNYDNPDLNQTVCGEAADRVRNGVEITPGAPRAYALEPLLKTYGVDLYLCGHKHDYERTFPIYDGQAFDKDYQTPSAVVQLLFGNAGNYEGPTNFDGAEIPVWSAARYSGYGYTRLLFHSRQHLEVFHYGVNPNGTFAGIVDNFEIQKTPHDEQDEDESATPWALVLLVALASVAVTASVGVAWFLYEERRGYIAIA